MDKIDYAIGGGFLVVLAGVGAAAVLRPETLDRLDDSVDRLNALGTPSKYRVVQWLSHSGCATPVDDRTYTDRAEAQRQADARERPTAWMTPAPSYYVEVWDGSRWVSARSLDQKSPAPNYGPACW